MSKQIHLRSNGKMYTVGEEIFNAVSHGVGAALGIAGLVIAVIKSISSGPLAIVCTSIYCATLIILYLMSTLYHAINPPKAKKVFRIFDHATIFLLIAGTYTPFALLTIGGVMGTVIFCVLWGLTILGIVLNSISIEKFKVFSMICYIAMGWCAVIAIKPLLSNLAVPGLILMLLGGICYTAGLIFYAKTKTKFMHSIWHLFVLAGSILHYFSILLYVL